MEMNSNQSFNIRGPAASAIQNTKVKRERGHNWSTKEKIILFECVKDYLPIVNDLRNAVEIRRKKNATWNFISKLAREMGIYVRGVFQIKTQWKRMKIAAKKNINAYKQGLIVDGKQIVPTELDWAVYNAIVNVKTIVNIGGVDDELNLPPIEIKSEKPDDYPIRQTAASIAMHIPGEMYSIEDESISLSHSDISIGSRISSGEFNAQCDDFTTQNMLPKQGSPLHKRNNQEVTAKLHETDAMHLRIEDHREKILGVQLRIEEAKLKEIEERIHQQRVIFELNKTLLQKQIENESVKKYT